ncbi:MAG: hypothetical protein IJU12_09380, partial [Clostridia bacterium]|nr:hypothetical protein [Clostridia bacterium]
GRMASIFFVRCKRENRRFSGAKSRFSRAADRNKDAASRAGELIRGSFIPLKFSARALPSAQENLQSEENDPSFSSGASTLSMT